MFRSADSVSLVCFCRCTTGSGNLNAFTGWPWRSCPITASARQKNGRPLRSSTSLHPFIKRLKCEWPLTSSLLMSTESWSGSFAIGPAALCHSSSPVPRWPAFALLGAWASCQNWYTALPVKHPSIFKSYSTKRYWTFFVFSGHEMSRHFLRPPESRSERVPSSFSLCPLHSDLKLSSLLQVPLRH